MQKLYEAVIFDFDGVLVDSLPAHVLAWNAASEQLFKKSLPDDLRTIIVGKQTRKISEMINSLFGMKDVDGLMREKASQVTKLSHEIRLMPGVLEYTSYLRESKIPYGVASNAPRAFVRQACDVNHLNIKVVLGFEDAARPKPAPDLFLLCASMLEIPVSSHRQCIVFEDSLHGIDAAVQAGMKAVGVTTHHSHKELASRGALVTIANVGEFVGRKI